MTNRLKNEPSRWQQPFIPDPRIHGKLPRFDFKFAEQQGLTTRNRWKRKGRRVVADAQLVAILQWADPEVFQADDVPGKSESVDHTRFAQLFSVEQTRAYKPTERTIAKMFLWDCFGKYASRERYIWWQHGSWISCVGKLEEDKFHQHLTGQEIYGIRGGRSTRFGAIDLDLHDGDPEIFLEQLRTLQAEFHGKDGWHYQVADANAGGVHLLQAFRQPQDLETYRSNLRSKLITLDQQNFVLAKKAHAAGMKSLADLEIFPNAKNGFRLPVCAGRTLLLDKPLKPVPDRRFDRFVPDIVAYAEWLLDPTRYMPAEAVLSYVGARLRTTVRTQRPQTSTIREQTTPVVKSQPTGGLASLGPMKGRYAEILVRFWTGELNPPDSLNQGIVLLARMLPYYCDDQTEAINVIERFIDELPDTSFSDRLSAGNRREVSRVVRSTVQGVWAGESLLNPEKSKALLDVTHQKWKSRGFNPTDKSTWCHFSQINALLSMFKWTASDMGTLEELQAVLKSDLETTMNATKFILCFVKSHRGQIAVSLVRSFLSHFDVKVGHNGKVNQFLQVLQQCGWLRMTEREKWHDVQSDGTKMKGKARSYAITDVIEQMFKQPESVVETQTDNRQQTSRIIRLNTIPPLNKYLYIVSHCIHPAVLTSRFFKEVLLRKSYAERGKLVSRRESRWVPSFFRSRLMQECIIRDQFTE